MKQLLKKICLFGEPAVGKTSLIRRFVFKRFDDKYISTLGTSVSKKTIFLPARHTEIQLLIWDVSGQREFKRIHNAALKGAKGAFLVCDSTRTRTIDGLADWIGFIRRGGGDVPVVLLANKSDLDRDIKLSKDHMSELAKEFDSPFLLTSAKTGENVEKAFQMLGEAMVGSPELTYSAEVPVNFEGEEITILTVEDEIIACFCENLGDTTLAMSIIRKQFTDAGIDFRNPTIIGIENIIDRLGASLVPFEGPDKAKTVRLEMKRILNRYKENGNV